MQGVTTNVLNPKVVPFFVSFFPQFAAAYSAHKTLAFLALGGVFVLQGLIWSLVVAWVAGTVTRRFAGNGALKTWLDRLVGSAFVGLGLRLAGGVPALKRCRCAFCHPRVSSFRDIAFFRHAFI